MTTVQKYPDDIENIIYEILASVPEDSNGISISDIFQVIIQTRKIDIKPEAVYQFIQRMCKEGMAEKIIENLYKGIMFDPEFPI
jgi:hypothetical protein